MTTFQRNALFATVVGMVGASVQAQVSTIDSAVIKTREFNDIPAAQVVAAGTYPSSLAFVEVGVSAPQGFANRDVWRFSADGANPYTFQNNEGFSVVMDLTLAGMAGTTRKEAGFLLSSTVGGEGQFIVNTDAHEVVAFGGPFPFYAFPATFDSGETIRLGMTYSWDAVNGNGVIVYSANDLSSPALPFTNTEKGIIDGSTLGGYFQIVNDPAFALNSGFAMFSSITIIPEPSILALLALGVLPLVLRRKN